MAKIYKSVEELINYDLRGYTCFFYLSIVFSHFLLLYHLLFCATIVLVSSLYRKKEKYYENR